MQKREHLFAKREHLFAKARELGLNEAVGCLHFAINFPGIVEEVMKRITKFPFIFYTHPKSFYEILQDFIKFEDMPTIPKPPYVSLSPHHIVQLHDYRKTWLEAVKVSTVRSETTKHKFSTLPVGLYEINAPENEDVDFSLLLTGNLFVSKHTEPERPERHVVFHEGTVLYRTMDKIENIAINTGDIYEGMDTAHAGNTHRIKVAVVCILPGNLLIQLSIRVNIMLPRFVLSSYQVKVALPLRNSSSRSYNICCTGYK